MKFSSNNSHLFFQLYLNLKEKILLGVHEPGSKLPNLEELHEKYDLSHGTVRRALDLLVKEGLIYKKQGSGTFVRDDIGPGMLIESSTTYEKFHRVLHTLEITPITQKWVVPPPQVKTVFSDHKGFLNEGRLFFVKRLLTSKEDSRRRLLVNIYFPAWVIEHVKIENPWKGRVHEIVNQMDGSKLFKLVQKIRPWICDSESAELLNQMAGTPVFHRSWLYLDQDNRPLAYTEVLTTAETLTNEIIVRPQDTSSI